MADIKDQRCPNLLLNPEEQKKITGGISGYTGSCFIS